jgi:hypothetical protein
MSLLQIPKTSHFAYFRGKISTNLALGFFPVQGAYQDQSIILAPNAVYLISDFTFVTNAKEGDFLEGLSDPANPADPGQELFCNIRRTVKGEIVNRWPIRLSIYRRQAPIQLWFETTTSQDTLTLEATGRIRQTAGMVADGISRLDVFLTFALYEIEDTRFKKLWSDP